MKNIEELYDLVPQLIEAVHHRDDNTVVFTDKAKALVHEIADYARTTRIWEETKEEREWFWEDTKDGTPELVYGYMLDRIVNAPTRLMRDSSVILVIPRLDELLNGEETNET